MRETSLLCTLLQTQGWDVARYTLHRDRSELVLYLEPRRALCFCPHCRRSSETDRIWTGVDGLVIGTWLPGAGVAA